MSDDPLLPAPGESRPGLVSGGDPLVPTLDFDVLVIGAGVAGLVTALDVAEAGGHFRIAVLDKAASGASRAVSRASGSGSGDQPGSNVGGSTPLAQGGLAAALDPADSPELHARDTIRAGDGLCDPRAVAVVTAEGPERVKDLVGWGALFDREPFDAGVFALAREGGQSVARSVRAADATGAEISRALRAAARGRVTRLQGVATELATAGNASRVVGAYAALDATPASDLGPAQSEGLVLVSAGATMLATGGCGGLFAATTNPGNATADGVALAHRAGAELRDMEFIQFHPTGMRPREEAGFQRFLLTEALRGAGATLVDRDGTRFMTRRHPDAELAPRYIVTQAILEQRGGVWLDATGLSEARLRTEFPTVLEVARRAGYDLRVDPVPVEPVQHYMIGGVTTDLHARTTVPGLWAAGEVACSGVHGANRMAGNSLLQASVFGHRAAQDMVAAVGSAGNPVPLPRPSRTRPSPRVDIAAMRNDLRRIMSAGAGAIRTSEGLAETAGRLVHIRQVIGPGPFATREATELANVVTVAGLIIESALLRTESRGVHWRQDHPSHDPLWTDRHLCVRSCLPEPGSAPL